MNVKLENLLPDLWRRMQLIRITEETIAERYSDWEMRCPVHLCTGQEFAGAAMGVLLDTHDQIVSGHRAHGHYLGKGGDLDAMIAEIHGRASGCCGGRGGSMHLIDVNAGFMGSTAIVANTIPVGVGLALAAQLQASKRIVTAFFGDGATEEGSWYESLSFAALKKLPILFVCENNRYSVYSSLQERQPEDRSITQLAQVIGVKSSACDSRNIESSLMTLKEATTAVRQGEGPYLVEVATYRWREHCGPNYDDDLGYRPLGELEKWQQEDGLNLLAKELNNRMLYSVGEMTAWKDECRERVDYSFSRALAAPMPELSTLSNQLFREEV
jgi:TPP-dependent pyruvate/acetoin dehydrogenase alpha subunit